MIETIGSGWSAPTVQDGPSGTVMAPKGSSMTYDAMTFLPRRHTKRLFGDQEAPTILDCMHHEDSSRTTNN